MGRRDPRHGPVHAPRGWKVQIAVEHIVLNGLRVACRRRALSATTWAVGSEAITGLHFVVRHLGRHLGWAIATRLHMQACREASRDHAITFDYIEHLSFGASIIATTRALRRRDGGPRQPARALPRFRHPRAARPLRMAHGGCPCRKLNPVGWEVRIAATVK